MRCTHLREEDRSFTGTWVTIKLFAALDRGYKILDVYEVWHFLRQLNMIKYLEREGTLLATLIHF